MLKLDLDFLQELIALRPQSRDVEQVNRAVERMAQYLSDTPELYLDIRELDGRKYLYASNTQSPAVDYIFNAHLDVVPADEADFVPRVEDGRIFGRGANDCLGSAVIVAQVMKHLAKSSRPYAAVFTSDEEIGGETTLAALKRELKVRKMAIIIDSGASAQIAYAQKGILSVELVQHGIGGHASAPWAFKNALEELMASYLELKSRWEALAEDHWSNTMAATIMSAGTAINKIPDTARLQLNIRYIHPEDREMILNKIRNAGTWEVNVLPDECLPVFMEKDHPELQNLHALMNRVLGREIEFRRMDGATDARHFNTCGIAPIAIIGFDGGNVHSTGEWSDIAKMQEVLEVLVLLDQGASRIN